MTKFHFKSLIEHDEGSVYCYLATVEPLHDSGKRYSANKAKNLYIKDI